MTRFGRRSALLVAALGVVAAMWTATPAAHAATPTPSFVPLTPARVLDTRSGSRIGNADGTGAPFELSVLGQVGVPASGVRAIALNVTATDGIDPDVGGGYVTVYPCGTRPNASNVNFVAGQTVPNLVVVPVSPTGTVCFYVYGAAHLLADVSGYFPTAGEFSSVTPARVLDTRSGAKVGNAAGTGAPFELTILGKGGLPTTGVGAVALNVTVAEGENPNVGGGYATVYPCGTRPDASSINFAAGQTVPNAVIAPVSRTGTVCFYVYGTAHLLADVSGWFPAGSDFVSMTPSRLVNTRGATKVGNAAGTGAILEVPVLGRAGLPGTAATSPVVSALSLNVTVTEGENPSIGGGYVTVFPCGTRPEASNLNFVAGQTVANAVLAPVSSRGTICFYVYGTAHLLADVSGYLTANQIAFFVTDDAGNPLPRAGLMVCNLDLDPGCNAFDNPRSDADGWIRIAVAPTTTYEITALIWDTGWPCPGFISPDGHPFWFGFIPNALGADLPPRTTVVIHVPTTAEC